MSSDLKVAIIGCGVIAPTHVKSFQNIDGVEVVWVCDLIKEKAVKLAEEYSIAHVTTDYTDVLDDRTVDCVAVCTDHVSHAPIAVSALDAGKHVICEKALGSTVRGMDEMCSAHERHPELVFAGVFQHRFDSMVRSLHRLVAEGAFGTLLNAGVQVRCLRSNSYYEADEWRGTWAQEGGSLLINQAIHFIDSLLWIVGGASEVCGAHTNITHCGVIETEDCAAAALRFNCGALGTIEATASSHIKWEPTISLHGVSGSIEVREGELVKLLFDNEDDEKKVRDEFEGGSDGKGVDEAKDYYGTGHPAQIADFIDSIRNHRKPFVTGEEARHAVDVVLGIYESHKTGRWVDLKRLD